MRVLLVISLILTCSCYKQPSLEELGINVPGTKCAEEGWVEVYHYCGKGCFSRSLEKQCALFIVDPIPNQDRSTSDSERSTSLD